MIGENFDTPIMYRDLASSTVGPMSFPLGGMYAPGIYPGYAAGIGRVRLASQPDKDKFETMNKKDNEGYKTMKYAAIALATIFALGRIGPIRKNIKKAGGISKYLSNKWDNFVDFIKGNKNPKVSWWQKFKNLFHKPPKP